MVYMNNYQNTPQEQRVLEMNQRTIDGYYTTMREAIMAYGSLGDETPQDVKDILWQALVIGLNLVQNEVHNINDLLQDSSNEVTVG